ncbi:YveK family protein [[Clostridium] polysaccharolyticum]|uniref:Capsular polysaccharide biosynthesis protein n=1 Tax=[Clostridium] polysaccharolyticum TaxID=29364 RepID=A0A1H9Y457_9FIRM|nr:Wzz/FepE/Etk N-terminal domain-containing protein [[Clostridium] polysaccharolyticum]SES63460.1 Capsular polysaccharide biosynthesis protein [[Clostridium] polysaccharolyticum]
MDNESTDGMQLDLLQAVRAVLKKWPIILCLACIASSLSYFYYMKHNSSYYTSYGKIYIIDRDETGLNLSIDDLNIGSQLVEDYKELIRSRFVLERVIKKLGLEITYEELAACVSVESPLETRIIQVAMQYDDRVKTQHILNAIEYVTCNDLASKLGTEHPTIVEKACEPEMHIKYSPLVKAAEIFFVVSFLIAGVIAGADIFNRNVRRKNDIVNGLNIEMLGDVPYVLVHRIPIKIRK